MEKEFRQIELRAFRARVTIVELLRLAGVSRVTYWRAVKGKHARKESAMKIWRQVDIAMTEIERG